MADAPSTHNTPVSQEGSTENTSQSNVRGKTDIGWGHCKSVLENGKIVMLCIYCDKIIRGGGINRFKCHLTGAKGQVEKCKKVLPEVQNQMKENLDEVKYKKRKTQAETEENYYYHPLSEETQESAEEQMVVGSQKGKNVSRIGSYFLPRTTPGTQPTLKSVLQSKEVIEKCDLAVAKWFIDASVPFNASNSAYYQPMADALCSMGPGYKLPNMHMLRGNLLNKWVAEMNKMVDDYRNIWKYTCCTLMADGWTDRKRQTLINFLVYCPKGTLFLKSVDASESSKTAQMLFNLFKEVMLSIGPENVVHIVTDNAANYVAAGKLLEREFPTVVWSPCAAHCINLMLQDIGKLIEVSDAVSHASNVTKYIYNHCYALYLMRKYTGGREILRPAPTRFATNFIALQSILAQKMHSMVTSKEWTTSAYAKEAKAKQFVDQVLDSVFWSNCVDIVKVTDALVRVLRIVDSEEKPAMGFIYQAIYVARAEMEKRFQRNKKKVEPYLKILDERWDSQLCKNIHAAGYWLNPACRYNETRYDNHRDTISGLFDVIDKYSHGNQELRRKLTAEVAQYKDAIGDFGRASALDDRFILRPYIWWDMYGTGAKNLQILAIRILSQTCSASGCERNRSVFEHIHSKKRNRLEHQKLNDLVFVRYNLWLQNRKKRNHGYDPINLETIGDYSSWILEESPPLLTNEELESLRGDLANMTIQPSSDNDDLHLDEDEDINVIDHLAEKENENNVGEDGVVREPNDEDIIYDDDVLISSYNE